LVTLFASEPERLLGAATPATMIHCSAAFFLTLITDLNYFSLTVSWPFESTAWPNLLAGRDFAVGFSYGKFAA
jgi:hypothetical protein